MRGVVYECPKGVFTRLMPGSDALRLLQEKKMKELDAHMTQLHKTYLKLEGR